MFSDARTDALGEGRRMSFASRASGRAKLKWNSSALFVRKSLALVAQLDRAPDFESGGRGFESLRARQHLGQIPKSARVTPRVTPNQNFERVKLVLTRG